jgi:hypothetical protein
MGGQQTLAKSSGSDRCKDHDRCKEHDKCRDHDNGHKNCKPKDNDKCKNHDKCREHDKCRQHDKDHKNCHSKGPDKCKDHDRCREHDKCRDHDKNHKNCNSKRCGGGNHDDDDDDGGGNGKCKDEDRCKDHNKCRKHDKGHHNCRPKVDKCKNRCIPHNKCRDHDKGHKNCRPQVEAESYSGRAIVVHLTNLLHGPTQVLIGDTGPLPHQGGTIEVDIDGTNVQDFLLIDMAGAITSGVSNEANSEVAIGGFTLRILATNGSQHTITFDSMHVAASAVCASNGPSVGASVTITGLKVDDQVITITGEPNQRIDYDGGFILVNVQASQVVGNYGEVTVAGLWIHNDGCMEGPIGLAHADIECHTRSDKPCVCSDRVTGGGFIFGTPSGERANFGVGGGMQNGRLWGHLNYKDHDTGMHVKATAVTGYAVVNTRTRRISYDVIIDGEAGTAVVEVADLGEPGRDDTFAIGLSNGYSAGGDLGGAKPGGGNIQLHKAKCR